MIKTSITKLLGITHPIIQGGMAWVADGTLAAAVSEGGGIGLIAGGSLPAEDVLQQIRAARARTGKPFGLNIMLMSPHSADLAQLAAEEQLAVVTTGAGNPGKYIPAWKDAGVRVIPVIPSVALAVRMERAGADAVVAEGCESGGHIGDLTTMALVPQVAQAVLIPVIAAGGIADGRGLAAAFMLGAQGVQIGTRFLVADECGIHDNYKELILKAKDTDTAVTGRIKGYPARQIQNAFTRRFVDMEHTDAEAAALEELSIGSLRRAAVLGDTENGSFMAGQVSGMITRRQPAAEIMEEIVSEAENLLIAIKDIRGIEIE